MSLDRAALELTARTLDGYNITSRSSWSDEVAAAIFRALEADGWIVRRAAPDYIGKLGTLEDRPVSDGTFSGVSHLTQQRAEG